MYNFVLSYRTKLKNTKLLGTLQEMHLHTILLSNTHSMEILVSFYSLLSNHYFIVAINGKNDPGKHLPNGHDEKDEKSEKEAEKSTSKQQQQQQKKNLKKDQKQESDLQSNNTEEVTGKKAKDEAANEIKKDAKSNDQTDRKAKENAVKYGINGSGEEDNDYKDRNGNIIVEEQKEDTLEGIYI